MEMLATLRRSGGVNALARHLDAPPAVATAGVKALLPVLLPRFSQFSGGTKVLFEVLSDLGGAGLATAVMAVESADPAPGDALLAQLFPSPDLFAVEMRSTAEANECDQALLERLFPLLAMLVGGYVSARAAAGTLSDSELAEFFASAEQSTPPGPEAV